MIFPGFPGVLSFFQVFQVFQVEWEPCRHKDGPYYIPFDRKLCSGESRFSLTPPPTPGGSFEGERQPIPGQIDYFSELNTFLPDL